MDTPLILLGVAVLFVVVVGWLAMPRKELRRGDPSITSDVAGSSSDDGDCGPGGSPSCEGGGSGGDGSD